MGTTPTINYGFLKPNPFEEEDTWGALINAVIDAIDTQIKARADAITALDAAKQPLDPQLTAIAGLAPAADRLPYFTGATTASLTTFTSFARSLLAGTSAAAMQTTLGLGALATLSTVNTAQIVDAAVTTAKIADAAVTTPKIVDGSVTAAKIAAGVIPAVFPSGTRMLFQQSSAPVGWTKDTTHDNKALRVVSGTAGSGGSWNFTDVFVNRGISGSTSSNAINGWVAYHTLSWNEMPAHTHDYAHFGGSSGGGTSSGGTSNSRTTTSAGSSWGHTHGWGNDAHSHSVSASLDMNVAYVDLIIATKN